MDESGLSETALAFRLKRAEEFARQWRGNAKRLQSLAANPQTSKSMRDNAIVEARLAAEIVARRATELAALAKTRGYLTWEADPKIGPLVVDIRAVENILNYVVETLGKASSPPKV